MWVSKRKYRDLEILYNAQQHEAYQAAVRYERKIEELQAQIDSINESVRSTVKSYVVYVGGNAFQIDGAAGFTRNIRDTIIYNHQRTTLAIFRNVSHIILVDETSREGECQENN